MRPTISKLPTRPRSVDPDQPELNLRVEKQAEPDGIGMGVLSDGTAFLTQRAIADLCGLRNKYIGILSSEWSSAQPPKEVVRVKEILYEQGDGIPSLPHVEVFEGKRKYFAYPAAVCTAILEYFAFEAGRQGAEIALKNFRQISRHGLNRYIYDATGYEAKPEEDVWRVFKDRASLTYDAVPEGYFGIFKEIATLIFTLGEAGLHIDENFVPDISVGQAWAKHWQAAALHLRFGERRTYNHNYPSYFAQAMSNPQLANCYPEDALGEFRRWFRHDYIGEGRFKRYLSKKVSERSLGRGYVERILIAVTKEKGPEKVN
ncbi:hypothetical protein GV827_00740 [Sulfitobacter sp. JBTF-M27]|uniref:BstA-like C-terminal domain-containing protein n=1 Tax=Sulfitobacter sediminilitoris TaxID=2698830 RepID=A0A6P0C729_9RHOB|nr:hypothetical protein [Sulfitobacter sediminilitoris]NEK20928.1 hypothetical protein [Sulfitobacter sediminilitoris]